MIEGQQLMQVSKLLRERDIGYEVIVGDRAGQASPLSARRGTQRNVAPIMPGRVRTLSKKFMDWKDYYPLSYIYNFMDELEKLYPSMCTVCVIGKTVEGRDIRLLKISNSDANNTGIWLDATIHAREWISTSVVTYIADFLARNFTVLPKYVTNKDWYILPVANPDGYYHTHMNDRMWRKNRARVGNVITGVDLNRNFSYNWGNGVSDGPSDPSSINYRGPEAFSEPETAAIKDVILYSRCPFKTFITFHSCSEVIAFPWCHTANPCPDYVTLLEGATMMAKAMYESTGRMYKVGNFKDIMYSASGTSIDWSYGTAHIPFSYLVELRSKQDRFLLPREEIMECCKEALAGVTALLEFVDQKRCLNNCTVLSKPSRM